MWAGDVLARSGGEEFALIVTGARADEDAEAVAERLRHRVEQAARRHEAPTTVSVGIAIHPRDGATAADLMRAADRALYAAKAAGRNRASRRRWPAERRRPDGAARPAATCR